MILFVLIIFIILIILTIFDYFDYIVYIDCLNCLQGMREISSIWLYLDLNMRGVGPRHIYKYRDPLDLIIRPVRKIRFLLCEVGETKIHNLNCKPNPWCGDSCGRQNCFQFLGERGGNRG